MFDVREIEYVLLKVVDLFLIPRYKQLGMETTGEWERSLEVVPNTYSGTIRGRHYSQQLALGRKPGKAPPVRPLQLWAMKKFGMAEREALGMAFALSKKIAKEGTSWYRKGGSNLLEVLEEPKTLDFIESELSAIATARLAENLIRNAQTLQR